MTVEQFKHWFEGFVNALELDLVSGFDHDDLEDIFDAIRKKMNEIETKESINVPENLPYIHPTTPHPPTVTVPHVNPLSPYMYYKNSTNIDRLSSWSENYNSTNKK